MAYRRRRSTTGRKRSYRRSYTRRSSYKRPRRSYRNRVVVKAPRAIRVSDCPKFFRAQVDPFDRNTIGVRVPDASTTPSSAVYCYDTQSLRLIVTLDSTGNAAAQIYTPSLKAVAINQVAGGIAGSATTFNFSGTFTGQQPTSKLANMGSSFNVYRPVAHGIRISCAGAATAVTGFLHIGLVALDSLGATGISGLNNLPTSISDMKSLQSYRKVTLSSLTQNPLVVVNKYFDQTAWRYIDINSNEWGAAATASEFQLPQSWMAIVIVAEGHGQAVGAEICSVESIVHVECCSKANAVNPDSPAEKANSRLMEAASIAVSQTGSSFIEGTVDQKEYQSDCVDMFARSLGMRGAVAHEGGYVDSQIGIQGVTNRNRLA
nr:MAG: capsid protein [Cressdnaviricota sp.]